MSKQLITGYDKGANIVLLNTHYARGKKDPDTGKYSPDMLTVLYKDLDTGEKKIETITNPEYTYYMAKPDTRVHKGMLFIEEDKCVPITCKYKDITKSIAEVTDNLEWYYNNLKTSTGYRENQKLHTLPNIFNSDMDIQDYFRYQFKLNYVNNPSYVPTKAYSDIETDTNYQKGDFPELGEVPVNSISYIDQTHKQIICFALVDSNNQSSIEAYQYSLTHDLGAECKEFCENHIGKKYAKKYQLLDFKYEFLFYDDELTMLVDFYQVVNTYQPDILMYWNGGGFDNPYLVERLKVLGVDPALIVSTPDATHPICEYYIDERNKSMHGQRGDWTFFTNHTIIIDQQVEFASIRKGQSAYDNMKLDNIANIVAGVRKLDWSKKFRTFSEFIRGDFKLFLFYNVCDTLAQYCIEFIVKDMEYMFSKANLNSTRYEKVHRQTVYLVNRATTHFRESGYIIGNNNNKGNAKPEKFPGALVGDPTHNNDYAKLKINGQAVNICHNLDDFDFKSLYPSIMREYNIAPNTQIGKILIDQQVWDGENPFKYGKYCRGGQFIEDFKSDCHVEFCKRWLHLAGLEEMIDDMKEYFAIRRPSGTMDPFDTRLIRPYDIEKSTCLIRRKVSDAATPLIYIYPEEESFEKEIAYLNETAQMDINDVEMILARKKREAEEDAELEKIFDEAAGKSKFVVASEEEE